ncbi:hypothetical protein [Streptomyces pilosus]|nr:hypothetical protein [Streptomyces pilosus]
MAAVDYPTTTCPATTRTTSDGAGGDEGRADAALIAGVITDSRSWWRRRMTTVEPVVRAALRALERDRGYIAPGCGNALAAHLTPRRPRALVAAIAERVTRKVLAAPATASPSPQHAA